MKKVVLSGYDQDFNKVFKKTFDKQKEMNAYVFNYLGGDFPNVVWLGITNTYNFEEYKFLVKAKLRRLNGKKSHNFNNNKTKYTGVC